MLNFGLLMVLHDFFVCFLTFFFGSTTWYHLHFGIIFYGFPYIFIQFCYVQYYSNSKRNKNTW